MLSWLTKRYDSLCYRKETGYQLNHLTLSVRDADTRREICKHQARTINTIITPIIVLCLVMTTYQTLDFFVMKNGFLISVFISFCQLCLILSFYMLQRFEYYRLSQYVISLIFVFHSSVTVLFFWEMLPEAL